MRELTKVLIIASMIMTSFAATARELLPKEKGILEEVTKRQLKDPDSAKFYWQDFKGGEIYCAHVNAKNSYGGFAGKALVIFGVKVDGNGFIISSDATVQSDNMMDSICTEAGYQV